MNETLSAIKVVGMDLDGTLLNSKKQVSKKTIEVLEQVFEQGVTGVIITGRPFSGVPDDAKNIRGVDYIISSNGASIVRLSDGKVIYRDGLKAKQAKEIFERMSEYDSYTEFYYEGWGYARKEYEKRLTEYVPKELVDYCRKTRTFEEDFFGKLLACSDAIEKINFVFKDMDEKKKVEKALQAIPDINVSSGIPSNLEVNAKHISKGEAAKQLLLHLGYEKEQFMAVGDSSNDIPMLEVAGCAVAMGNAIPVVKEMADLVTSGNDEDGIAQIFM